MPQNIGTRQIHLDFHTSEQLPGVGLNFSKAQFQAALKEAHVNAINVFAKCHHSWSYYPTKVGKMHPNLTFDLLAAQIEACHEIDVLAPIYYTVGWSVNDANTNPDWVMRDINGDPVTSAPFDWTAKSEDARPTFHWIFLCPNTGYHDHMMAQVEELSNNYPVDGFWFDIYQAHRLCYCEACKKGMLEQKMNIDNQEDVQAYRAQVIKKHQQDMRNLISSYHPNATVFFNGVTSVERDVNFKYELFSNNTVQDLEDLPTTWGGYDKLPMQSKYFLKAGYPITAMSGKFHTAWGEFGGFKHPNALRYEAASMIAWGAHCNFGDQLHPSGEMDMATYKNMSEAYAYVEQIEDYGIGGMPLARVGFWRCFELAYDEGLARILLESHINFDIANLSEDLSQFDVILIPGKACLSQADADRLNTFVQQGGSLIVMAKGALNKNKDAFLLDLGANYLAEANCDIDYLLAGQDIAEGLVQSPFLNYEAAIRVQADKGTEVLASIHEPYFSRTYGKFTSHQNTPYQLEPATHPGIVRKGKVIFIAHALDKLYFEHGARLHRDIYSNVLKLLHKRPMLETKLPSAARISLLHQAQHNRYVAHLLYGPPIQRGRCEVIEDLPSLYNVPVTVDLPHNIKQAFLVPQNERLEMITQDSKTSVTVPQFSCHTAVVFKY